MSKRHLLIFLISAAILYGAFILAETKSAQNVRFSPPAVELETEPQSETVSFPVMSFTYDEADSLLSRFENEKTTARRARAVQVTYASGGYYAGTFYCTAYCPCYECSEGYGNMTATGVRARAYHTIAVDPRVIPYGARVTIDGITYVAEDCGGGVNGRHIDIYFDTHYEAMCYDTGYHDVYINY